MKHVVNFSGGWCSFWAAHRVIQRHGPTDVTLLFADVLIEDPELYAFNAKASALLGVPITRVSREMTPWELFRKKGMIANNRFPICSVILKREMLDGWTAANCDPSDTIIYVGFDWTEEHRLLAIRAVKPKWHWEAPMCETPIWDKCRMQQEAIALGFAVPQLYRLGFPHNNCGGRCVRAGITHWVHLLKTLPERFLEWEQEEQATIQSIKDRARLTASPWHAMLRDRRGGKSKPMTLLQLRLRVEAGEKFPDHEWGGCGCGGVMEAGNE